MDGPIFFKLIAKSAHYGSKKIKQGTWEHRLNLTMRHWQQVGQHKTHTLSPHGLDAIALPSSERM